MCVDIDPVENSELSHLDDKKRAQASTTESGQQLWLDWFEHKKCLIK